MSCTVLLYFSLANAELTDIADQCDECHGAGGVSTESDVPSVAGISPFIIEEYMLEFRDAARICRESKYRSGDLERPATDMCVIAKDLSEGDIAEIADYYGSKDFTSAKQSFDADKAAAGTSLHKKHCRKCHADGGSYADDDASILAGQWMPYLEQVFADYVAGNRNMLEDKMKEKMGALSDEESEALIHFYGSQQ
ncbi:MAG: c-type cytochrome [Proteobacteria bacterium]|nr:c-type cytochrome [Pseudomonadota bacterium]